MKVYRTIRTAMRALRRNPMRALLTTLGIVIGVAAVIAMMEIGAGSSAAVQKSISSMGANVVLVMPGTATSGGISFGFGSVTTLTPDDADGHSAGVPRRQDRRPGRPRPGPGRLRQSQLGPLVDVRHDAGVPRRPRLDGRRGRPLHRPRRAQRQQGLPDRADPGPRAVRRRRRRSARRFASRTSPSAWSACSAARGPT